MALSIMFQCAHLVCVDQTAPEPAVATVVTEDVLWMVEGVLVAVMQDGWMFLINAELVKCDL